MEDLTIGQRIAVKRRELGLSQIALGEQMGVSRQSISKWEADAAIPEIDKLIALSKLFSVSVGWLLGVENNTEPEAPAEAEFTDREWELIDRLTQNEPKLPKWLMPLTGGTTALALAAMLLAGSAFASAQTHRADLAAVSQAISSLSAGTDLLTQDTTVLDSYQFLLEPDRNMEHCTFRFLGYPPAYSEGSTAELLIFADGEEVCREKCRWNGTAYEIWFTLKVRNGYRAIFTVTSKSGVVRSTAVPDYALYQTQDAAEFGEMSVEMEQYALRDEAIVLTGLQFTIDAPALYRDLESPWQQCDLVILADGQELGRADVLNRSIYSKDVNFGGDDVSFYTRSQSIHVGDISGYNQLELLLEGAFNTGLTMQKVIKTWTVQNGKLVP